MAVSVSEAAAATIRRAAAIDSEVLFNGLEVDRFLETPRQRTSETVLMFVGRLEERKGVASAIEATLAHNKRGASQWRLVIAGDGPDRSRLETLAHHDGAIEFLGSVSDEEKRSRLRRVDVLLATSTYGESFGVVLLEGMASETLVVASDIEGYREAANGHATLYSPGGAVALEEAITLALEGASDTRVSAASAYALNWSMEKLVDEYEERYERAHRLFLTTQ